MTIGLIFLVLFIPYCVVAFSYRNIRCPSQSEWRFISSWVCNGTETQKYTCLYNAIKRKYEESCKFQPVISGNGSQYVISLYPNSEPCRNYDRYQPFPLGSNAGSDCVFQKSTCIEEGNILFHHGSPKKDLSCRCNFQKGYGFVNEIPNKCDCVPSQEDCSCYLKKNQCLPGYRLISDYVCLHENDRKHIHKCPEMGPDNSRNRTQHLRQLSSKELKNIDFVNRRVDFIGWTCLAGTCCICIVYAIFASLLIITNKIPNMCSIDICPFNLKITPVGSSLRISWSISDKVPTIDILGYNIYYTYNGKWKQIYVKEERLYLFNKLKPSKTYRFKVSACLRNRVESKCTQEETFNTELPIQPKVGIPKGENSKIVLTWNSPRNTLIKIEGYEIQWSIDKWHTIADKTIVASNVFRHEIETAKEGVIYWVEICSCSNSVKSLYEVFQPFTTRHDMFTMEVTYDTYDQKDKDLVQNNVDEIFKHTCNGFPGDQKIIHKSKSEGSIVVTIMFISEGFNDEKVLHDTLKNAFQKEMIGSHTIKFKSFWLKRLNDPSPPQLVKASSVNNGVLVSWKEPFITFFKTKEYVVEYTEDDWISTESIAVPVDENSCFITKVLPSANIQVKVYTCICHSIRSSPCPVVSTVVKVSSRQMNSVDENDSIWLFDVLEDIGVNDKFRKTCQQSSIQQEILTTFNAIYTCYMFGGSCEGTITPGGTYDSDGMLCDDRFPVVDDLRKTYKDIMSFFIVTEPHTPAGYVKLQVASQGKPLTSEWWHAVVKVGYSNRFKLDNCGRLLMTGPHAYMTNRSPSFCSFAKNKPTIKTNFIETGMSDLNISYRCQTWPTIAQEWLARPRSYGWPTKDTIQELKSLGFFVVRKGHPSSRDKDLEWRISFTLQERKLMFNLTDVEHKCYIVLKMLNRDIIDINYLSSFHWKTCLFYVIEDNMRDVWKKERIFKCIELCIRQMLKWVKEGICPNYFIPKDNLFDERIDVIGRFKATQILEKILKEGFSSLLRVTTSNLCDYIKTRNYSEMYQCHANSKNNYERAVYNKKVEVIKAALTVYHYEILKCYKADECITNFIEFLWRMVDKIEKSGPIAEHTKDETKLALSFLKPFVYTCLASIISAMVINNSNLQVRDFLLLGSFTYFMKGDLPGRLKFISVLYAIGLYTDCEWFLDQLNEEHIKCNPSVCLCNDIERGYLGGGQIQTDESCLKVNTCVTFLQTEIPITPNALKYEMFKYFGIPLQENEVTNIACYRRNRAFVDSNIYFLLIKYLIKTKLGGVNAVDDFESDFVALIGENVKHLDVGYNLFAWIIHNGNFMNTPRVLYSLQQSYKRMDASDIGSLKEKLKPKQNQFNSVIIRTLVVLYDTWIAREPYFIVFCFHCFKVATLKTCSVCKKARYCSRRCQRKNWNIHKAVCEIVRSCHSF